MADVRPQQQLGRGPGQRASKVGATSCTGQGPGRRQGSGIGAGAGAGRSRHGERRRFVRSFWFRKAMVPQNRTAKRTADAMYRNAAAAPERKVALCSAAVPTSEILARPSLVISTFLDLRSLPGSKGGTLAVRQQTHGHWQSSGRPQPGPASAPAHCRQGRQLGCGQAVKRRPYPTAAAAHRCVMLQACRKTRPSAMSSAIWRPPLVHCGASSLDNRVRRSPPCRGGSREGEGRLSTGGQMGRAAPVGHGLKPPRWLSN